MKWIKTHNGDKAHAVCAGAFKTLCGIKLIHVAKIVSLGVDDRCGNCDAEWRERGRQKRPTAKRAGASEYRPRFTYSDWENAE